MRSLLSAYLLLTAALLIILSMLDESDVHRDGLDCLWSGWRRSID